MPNGEKFFLSAERLDENSTVFHNGVELNEEKFPTMLINLSRAALLAEGIDPDV
jgi:hypothetical protein